MRKQVLAAFVVLLALAIYCFAALPVNVSLLVNQNPLSGSQWVQMIPANGNIRATASEGAFSLASSYQDSGCYWIADSFANDQYATVTVKNYNSNSNDMWMGPAVRASGTNAATFTGYVLYIGKGSAAPNDYAELYLRQNGNWTTEIAHDNATVPQTGDVYEIHVVGNSITTKRNGVAYLSGTDSTLTSGAAGMFFYGGSSSVRSISNFTAGNEASSRRRPPVVAMFIPRQPMQ
ncbi:MAG TPA: hypothetical protein VEG30_18095 [Terriglobales bacterium]|nr:hypothetical protein [Terriglobales bacterium]